MNKTICKKEYDLFIKKIESLFSNYCLEKNDKNVYYINTPYGKLRININKYNRNFQWICTMIEYPEKLPQIIREKRNIGKISGKYNNLSNDFNYLLAWLYCYIEDLINPKENKELRDPYVEMLHDKEGKFSLYENQVT